MSINGTWQTAKTNWKATDYINYTDYERIRSNTEFIEDMARTLYVKVTDKVTMPTRNSYSAIPYATDWNAIETNIDNVNRDTLKLNIGTKKTFKANGYYIDYVELNRIEDSLNKIYNGLKSAYDLLPRLQYRLGSPKFRF